MGPTLTILETVACGLVATIALQLLTSPLRNLPGPFLAKLTNLYSFFDVWGGNTDKTNRQLHKKYGPAVRVGPNCVSLNDPSLIKTIYSTKEKWPKSEFYSANDVALGRGQVLHTLFSARDEEWHTTMTKPFNRLYTMTSVLRFESQVNDTIQHFLSRLNEEFVSKRKPCAIDKWLHYYAWDVIGKVTFSRELGFLESAGDVDNLIRTGEKAVDYFCVVGQIPFLDRVFDKNPIYRIGPPSFGSAAGYGAKQMQLRISGEDKHDPETETDFLDLFLEAKENDPDIDDNLLTAYLMANVVAGSDTTAIELRAVVYYLCKHSSCMKILQGELEAAGLRDSTPKSWKDVSKLPYLDAVIKESLRLHPAVGMPLERVVPEPGLWLPDGRVIPTGTVVGMNPMVLHRNAEVFGAAPDDFVPARWLQQDGEDESTFEARVARMKDSDLTFGFGKRMCSGRFVAILEVYKVIATLFTAYDVRLVDPEKEWKTRNSWFVRQWDMDVWLEPRGR